jgi:thiamine pyrophosphokinase
MKYKIKVGEKIVFQTSNWNDALKAIKEVFKKGYDDVYLVGGQIGYWR